MVRAHGGCLGTGSRRRTRQAAIILGEGHMPCDPRVSEWANPAGSNPRDPPAEHIRGRGATRGTETSKYPEEEKSTETPRVAASERGRGQTGGSFGAAGVVGPAIVQSQNRAGAERPGTAGGTGLGPRTRTARTASRCPSTAGHVEPGGKQGGPPPKAKYSLATDSEQVP